MASADDAETGPDDAENAASAADSLFGEGGFGEINMCTTSPYAHWEV